MVPFLIQVKQNGDLARRLAERCNLPGADNLFVHSFNEKFGLGQYQEAAKIAARAPKVTLIDLRFFLSVKQFTITPLQDRIFF